MKLYYFPDACSLAVHIALRETRQEFSLVEVDYATRRLDDGTDFADVNPKGSVPALRLDDGELLTEAAVILQYVASRNTQDRRFLPGRNPARRRCLEWLNYVATELHKSASPLFRATTPRCFMKPGRDHLVSRLDFVETTLHGQDYLAAGSYSIADMYLFAVTRWLPSLQFDIRRWPGLAAHYARMLERPSVQTALAAEAHRPRARVENARER